MKLIHFGVAAREGLTTNCLVTTEYCPSFASRRIISVFTVAVNEARTSVMEVTVRYTCDSTHDAVPDDGCNGVQGPDGKRDVYRPALARRLKERSYLKTASSDRLLRLAALIHTPMCVPYVELA